MAAAKIKLDALDSLFDNQKKVNDVFNSSFDEDFLLSNSISFDDQVIGGSNLKNSQDPYFNEELSIDAEDETFVQKKRNITYFVVPMVIEIAALYYGIMYFI